MRTIRSFGPMTFLDGMVIISLLFMPVLVTAQDRYECVGVDEVIKTSCNGTAASMRMMLNVLRRLDAEVPDGAAATKRLLITQLRMEKLTLDGLSELGTPCQTKSVKDVLDEYRELVPTPTDARNNAGKEKSGP